ncbi:MAG: aryl-sulfate sulfotransferase [Alphaproteobacteria bacterium]|nr:MAG: aryl-sulfate sulfotransferase [Alphaproteobacteria bacterium]
MTGGTWKGAGGRIRKYSVTIAGHRTSISLEPTFWEALNRLARRRGQPVAALIAEIDRERGGNLSSALRLYVFENRHLLED